MQIESIREAAYAMDGGSIYLDVRDVAGNDHTILLVQHRIPSNSNPDRLFGRLYVDDQLVPVRSQVEFEILSSIETARVENQGARPEATHGFSQDRLVLGADLEEFLAAQEAGVETATAHLVQEFVRYVRSQEYVENARSGPGAG